MPLQLLCWPDALLQMVPAASLVPCKRRASMQAVDLLIKKAV
jgi:hypothetical protein